MSEPLFQHIYLSEHQSYNILKVDRPYFVVPWHFHPEIEIMNIVKGEGTRFVGDNIESFESGDLVVVGSNLPHCWKNGPQHYEESGLFRAKARVILFREDSFGKDFFSISEFRNIHEMLTLAQRGICYTGKTSIRITDKLAKSYSQKGIRRFMSFIDILNDLAESKEYRLLASVNYKSALFTNSMQRLNKVFDYLMENFKKPLKLEDIAAIAYMSPTAFCRYFKAQTNKTVINFLTELRIGFAKKLLIDKTDNISDIYYLCGFHNASNFYEQFRKIAGCSPLEFRKNHANKVMPF